MFDQALHPGMNLTLTVSTSNTGSLDGHLSVELNCNNGAFVDTKQVIVPPGFSGEMNIVYELHTALSFGELLCKRNITSKRVSTSQAPHDPLAVRVFIPTKGFDPQ